MVQNKYTRREITGKNHSYEKTFLYLESMIKKVERFSWYLMEYKKRSRD